METWRWVVVCAAIVFDTCVNVASILWSDNSIAWLFGMLAALVVSVAAMTYAASAPRRN